MYKTNLLTAVAIVAFVSVALIGCDSREENQSAHEQHPLEDIKSTVHTYVKSGLAGDREAVASVCLSGKAVAEQALTDLPEIGGLSKLELIIVHADTQNAIVVSNPISADHGRQGALVFTLKIESGKWLIADIDVEDQEGVTDEIKRFKQKYSSADKLL